MATDLIKPGAPTGCEPVVTTAGVDHRTSDGDTRRRGCVCGGVEEYCLDVQILLSLLPVPVVVLARTTVSVAPKQELSDEHYKPSGPTHHEEGQAAHLAHAPPTRRLAASAATNSLTTSNRPVLTSAA
ncbi:MAG: hypothetical protein ABSE77_14375 [Acidimicrobiales bacterium]